MIVLFALCLLCLLLVSMSGPEERGTGVYIFNVIVVCGLAVICAYAGRLSPFLVAIGMILAYFMGWGIRFFRKNKHKTYPI